MIGAQLEGGAEEDVDGDDVVQCNLSRYQIFFTLGLLLPTSSASGFGIPSQPSNSTDNPVDGSGSSKEPVPTGSSAHSNPDWLKNMKRDFKTEIISKCSMKVREAIENKLKIEDIRERKSVRNEIINTLVAAVSRIFGGVSRPRISEIRQLVVELQILYPAMFKEEDSGSGYGFGGVKGNDGLDQHIMDRLRKVDRENQTKAGGSKEPVAEGVAVIVAKKKGKRKLIYGKQ